MPTRNRKYSTKNYLKYKRSRKEYLDKCEQEGLKLLEELETEAMENDTSGEYPAPANHGIAAMAQANLKAK